MSSSPVAAILPIDSVVVRELVGIAELDPMLWASELDWVGQLQAIDRLTAWAQAQAYRVLAAAAPPDTFTRRSYLDEQHVIEEIQIARRRSQWAAHTAIDTSRALSTVFTEMFHALEEGQTSDSHVRVLVALTAVVSDDPVVTTTGTGTATATAGVERAGDPGSGDGPVVAWRDRDTKVREIQRRVLDRARGETVGAFRTSVVAAICAVDPLGEADRRAKAKQGRSVTHRGDTDGMGQLYARDEQTRTLAILTELTRRARALQTQRGGATAARTCTDATLAACRADALAAAVLGTGDPTDEKPSNSNSENLTPDIGSVGGSLEPRGLVIDAHLVMDLATLRREQDNPCTLDGVPITAAMGREVAATVVAWRRMVTAPVTGHLLDYGDRTYLPAALVKFISARDGQCTAPYCERKANRCQMDHRVPFPDGPSSAANCGELCDRHHPLKTAGYLTISNGKADGSMTWNTLLGQQVYTPPRAFLDNPQPEQQRPTADTGPPNPSPPTDRYDHTPPF
jgi:hypothetical protein